MAAGAAQALGRARMDKLGHKGRKAAQTAKLLGRSRAGAGEMARPLDCRAPKAGPGQKEAPMAKPGRRAFRLRAPQTPSGQMAKRARLGKGAAGKASSQTAHR